MASALWLLALALLLIAPRAAPAAEQEPVVERRSKLEAAFLRNFARYVSWPPDVFGDERAPWLVCILDGDHFDQSLEPTFEGRTEQGRSFRVLRAHSLDDVPECHIAFVGYDSAPRRRAALARLKDRPVLTVGSAPDFLSEGGMVRLLAGERIEMSINLDRARGASLVVATKMLEVARDVVENGQVRKWR